MDANELSKLYPNKAQWDQAVMDCIHSRKHHLGNSGLSVDELWDKSESDVIERYKELEPKQPASTLSTGYSVHDLVIIDLIRLTDGNQMLAKALWDRKGQDPFARVYGGEILDYICYLKLSLLEGKSYLEPIYHRSIALAIDQMNLSYVNSGGEIEGQCPI